LKLSRQSVRSGFDFLREPESNALRGDHGGDGVGTLIIRFVISQSDWSSGSRVSSVVLLWSFLHSLSRRVTDLYRWLTSVFRLGSLVTGHCLRNRSFGHIKS
jgi:hypothetical protein